MSDLSFSSSGPLERGHDNNNRELSLEDLVQEIKLLLAEAVLRLNDEQKNQQGRDVAIECLLEVIMIKPESELANKARKLLAEIRAQDPSL